MPGSNCTLRLLSTCLLAIASAMLLPAIPVAAAAEEPMQEWDGLVRQSGNRLDNVYVRPNVQFKNYKRVRLPPVDVSFAKDWEPNRGSRSPSLRMSNEEVQSIRAGLSELFHMEFARRLAKAGYTLSDANGDDVLIVQAALANLYITTPQTDSEPVMHMDPMKAGRVSVVMQLSDSVTQQLLARVVDTQQGDGVGNLNWTSSVSNSVEARRFIGIWAEALVTGLDKVNGKVQ